MLGDIPGYINPIVLSPTGSDFIVIICAIYSRTQL